MSDDRTGGAGESLVDQMNSQSSNRRRRGLWARAGIVVTGSILVVLGAIWWITRPAIPVSGEADAAASKVLLAYHWSRLSGGYWENEFVAQSRAVAKRPMHERIEFYEAVLIDCDLDTSRATIFFEEVGDDAQPLL